MRRHLKDRQQILEKVRSIADYQFGKGSGIALFPDNAKIVFSRKTGKIRHVYMKGSLLATLRPRDGMYSITVEGAKRLARKASLMSLWVKVSEEAEPFIAKGKSVFAKHVIDAGAEIRPQDEVTVLGSNDKVLAVGKASLTGWEMKTFKRGLAVRVRRGVAQERTFST